MKNFVFQGLITLFLMGCFSDELTNTKHLVKNFNLGWWAEPKYQSLFENSNSNEYGGSVIIPETVFSVGYNDDFIIAKQHPNNDDTISWNNINEHETWKLDKVPSDTLDGQKSFVKINGEWRGISNGRNVHHDLFPDKKITYYYILDMRKYELPNWKSSENLYKLNNEEEFKQKRKELSVPEKLTFTQTDSSLQ